MYKMLVFFFVCTHRYFGKIFIWLLISIIYSLLQTGNSKLVLYLHWFSVGLRYEDWLRHFMTLIWFSKVFFICTPKSLNSLSFLDICLFGQVQKMTRERAEKAAATKQLSIDKQDNPINLYAWIRYQNRRG